MMSGPPLDTDLLKGVSRSFYLSLRILPPPMREAAGIGYLLARSSDTIADSAKLANTRRLELLAEFLIAIDQPLKLNAWPNDLIAAIENPKEKSLLKQNHYIFRAYSHLPPVQRELVSEVVKIIADGQKLDLERFAPASAEQPVSLTTHAELDDYTWRVAGCVGVFWTKLAHQTLGSSFSTTRLSAMCQLATDYGKGLQLVNILRDLPEDLENGRCYLPVTNPTDRTALMLEFEKWRLIAITHIESGLGYARHLPSRRLRVASILPAMIARETLSMMNGTNWETLKTRIKIPRRKVHQLIFRSIFGKTS